MSGRRNAAERTISSFLSRTKKSTTVEMDTGLFEDGVKLDSLEAAELSALLEDELGSDPFSEGEMPQTVGELIAFYDEDESGDKA
jgi:acyl carrier protein